MKLQDFLALIGDDELRIKLEIRNDAEDYSYMSFWLSDYRVSLDVSKYYEDWDVVDISFLTDDEDIIIAIKKGLI